MTITTTLNLPHELKARIAAVAQQSGKSEHAFMVEALELQTGPAKRRTAFVADALLAREEVARFGLAVEAYEVFDYLKARAEGRATRKPDPSSILAAGLIVSTRVVLAPRALADLERLTDYLLQADAPATAAETLPVLQSGLAVPREHPLIGRKVEHDFGCESFYAAEPLTRPRMTTT